MTRAIWLMLAWSAVLPWVRAAEPSPAQSATAAAASPEDDRLFRSRLTALLQSNLHYPPFARNLSISGTAMVRVRLNRAGEILSAALIRSSGEESLDIEAVAVWGRINAAEARIPVPGGYLPSSAQFQFEVPVAFVLE